MRPRTAGSRRCSKASDRSATFDVARNGAIAARVETGTIAAGDLFVRERTPRKLTRLNDEFLRGVALGAKETVSSRAPDGTEVQAFVTKPPGFVAGRRYPTILHIHGGPVGQFG